MQHKNLELMNQIIDFIDNEYFTNGTTPTMQEIADKLKISKGSVSNYIKYMAKEKKLSFDGGSRSIKTNKMKKSLQLTESLPVVGTIACGSPLLAEENIESYLPIPNKFLGSGKFFILKAVGNSMVNVGISNGDYVIIKQQETAEEGQIVVALIDNNEATLKRYYLDKKKKKVRLHPENDDMQDMYFDNIQIQGVAIKVIKDL